MVSSEMQLKCNHSKKLRMNTECTSPQICFIVTELQCVVYNKCRMKYKKYTNNKKCFIYCTLTVKLCKLHLNSYLST